MKKLDINLVSNMGKVENFIVLGYAKDEKNKLKIINMDLLNIIKIRR